jgi:hypothetical protein
VEAFKQAENPGMLQSQRDEFLFPFANLEDLCSEGGTKCTIHHLISSLSSLNGLGHSFIPASLSCAAFSFRFRAI